MTTADCVAVAHHNRRTIGGRVLYDTPEATVARDTARRIRDLTIEIAQLIVKAEAALGIEFEKTGLDAFWEDIFLQADAYDRSHNRPGGYREGE